MYKHTGGMGRSAQNHRGSPGKTNSLQSNVKNAHLIDRKNDITKQPNKIIDVMLWALPSSFGLGIMKAQSNGRCLDGCYAGPLALILNMHFGSEHSV